MTFSPSFAVRVPNLSAGEASGIDDRLVIEDLLTPNADPSGGPGADVIAGLTAEPKALPPKYFYDDRGSQLFEQITTLPEYYLTRTETAILQTHGADIAELVGPCELVELGSGSSTKTRYLLTALAQAGYPLYYQPVDVSGGMLKTTAKQLLVEYPRLCIHGLVATYEAALAHPRPASAYPRLLTFIGSTLGNLDPDQCRTLLGRIRLAMNPGDYFLLGVDLVKDRQVLERAYNDSQGVTAAFNLNMLQHLNWRFGGNFDLGRFRHRAEFNPLASQIEIYIDSLETQTVYLEQLDLGVKFTRGEPLLSEISRKFNLPDLTASLTALGLPVQQVFTDAQDWFALLLCRNVVAPPAA